MDSVVISTCTSGVIVKLYNELFCVFCLLAACRWGGISWRSYKTDVNHFERISYSCYCRCCIWLLCYTWPCFTPASTFNLAVCLIYLELNCQMLLHEYLCTTAGFTRSATRRSLSRVSLLKLVSSRTDHQVSNQHSMASPPVTSDSGFCVYFTLSHRMCLHEKSFVSNKISLGTNSLFLHRAWYIYSDKDWLSKPTLSHLS